MRGTLTAGLLLFVVLHTTASGQALPRTELSVADVLGLARFTPESQIGISPDGELIAFVLQEPARAAESVQGRYFSSTGVPRFHRGTDVHIADARSGSTRRITDGRGSSWGPVWSPDGALLAFYSDRDGVARVWLWDREKDRLERLSDEAVRPYWGFEQMQWSPDGTRLLVKAVPAGMSVAELERLLPQQAAETAATREGGAAGASTRVFVHPAAGTAPAVEGASRAPPANLDSVRSFLNVQLGDLVVLDVPTGRVQRVATGVRAMAYRFSPSGDRVAFSTRQPDGGTGMVAFDRYDVWAADIAGGAPRLLVGATRQEFGLGFSWSPDGKRLACLSGDSLQIRDARTGAELQTFTRDNVRLAHDYRAPMWLDDGSLLLAAADTLWRLELRDGSFTPIAVPRGGRLLEIVAPAGAQRLRGSSVVVAVVDDESKRIGFERIDLAEQTTTQLFAANIALGTSPPYQLVRSPDGSVVAFVAETAETPANIWMAATASADGGPLTDLHPGVSQLQLARSRLVQWQDAQGRALLGALLLPAGYEPGRRYPLVVKVYGGTRRSAAVNRFGLEPGAHNLQLLASRGYAVLVPDAPARVGTPMADIVAAVLGGVDAVIASGVADPGRVAVLGHSYGGYSALALATASPLFRAVISVGGMSNLFSEYGAMREDGSAAGVSWAERGQGRMGGSPWEHPERYRTNSPFFFLDRVTAPILLLHGGNDTIVRPASSMETFVALRRLGKVAKLVIFEGEVHDPAEWTVAGTTEYWQQIFDWLATHLPPP